MHSTWSDVESVDSDELSTLFLETVHVWELLCKVTMQEIPPNPLHYKQCFLRQRINLGVIWECLNGEQQQQMINELVSDYLQNYQVLYLMQRFFENRLCKNEWCGNFRKLHGIRGDTGFRARQLLKKIAKIKLKICEALPKGSRLTQADVWNYLMSLMSPKRVFMKILLNPLIVHEDKFKSVETRLFQLNQTIPDTLRRQKLNFRNVKPHSVTCKNCGSEVLICNQ